MPPALLISSVASSIPWTLGRVAAANSPDWSSSTPIFTVLCAIADDEMAVDASARLATEKTHRKRALIGQDMSTSPVAVVSFLGFDLLSRLYFNPFRHSLPQCPLPGLFLRSLPRTPRR